MNEADSTAAGSPALWSIGHSTHPIEVFVGLLRGHGVESVADVRRFESGLSRLAQRAERSRVVVMCSEENPAGCHRFLLVTRVLHDQGIEVTHIRGDGSTQRTEDVDGFQAWSDPVYEDVSLLDGSVSSSWRSTRPGPRGGSR